MLVSKKKKKIHVIVTTECGFCCLIRSHSARFSKQITRKTRKHQRFLVPSKPIFVYSSTHRNWYTQNTRVFVFFSIQSSYIKLKVSFGFIFMVKAIGIYIYTWYHLLWEIDRDHTYMWFQFIFRFFFFWMCNKNKLYF